MKIPTYQYYNHLFKGRRLPLAYVDLDLLDENIDKILKRVGKGTIRVASKSVRCTSVLRRILDASPQFQGLMTFMPDETLFLSEQGFDDLLMGYPTVNEEAIRKICETTKSGKRIILMVDCEAHLKIIDTIAKEIGVVQLICIDIDMSSDFPGIHFGVDRSPVKSLATFKALVDKLPAYANIHLEGVMGYEAQIAGLGDKDPTAGLNNYVIPLLKKWSIKEISKRRKDCVEYARSKGYKLPLVNGGGTGSIESTLEENWVTEVTVGSGFFSPGLFDHYKNFHHLPAAGFAVEIIRKPSADIYTCMGGGYIASGAVGKSKEPVPYLPKGIKLTANEGTGEVQTPVIYKGTLKLEIGDTILFRHAKAGEICERFNTMLFISQGKITDEVPTYRGQGKCFV